MRYLVDIEEIKRGWVHIEADSKDEARRIAEEMAWNDDYETKGRRFHLQASEVEKTPF